MAGMTITKSTRIASLAALLSPRMQKLLDRVRQAMEDRAKELAPVDTGYLRDHIEAVLSQFKILLISEAPYSSFVEYGTRYAAAQPFMHPAIDAGMAVLKEGLKELFKL